MKNIITSSMALFTDDVMQIQKLPFHRPNDMDVNTVKIANSFISVILQNCLTIVTLPSFASGA